MKELVNMILMKMGFSGKNHNEAMINYIKIFFLSFKSHFCTPVPGSANRVTAITVKGAKWLANIETSFFLVCCYAFQLWTSHQLR